MRRYGRPPRPHRSYRDRPGAYGVILGPRGVLLAQSGTEDFLFPGGGVDPGESLLAALHREILEETGWRVAVIRRAGWFQRYAWLPDYQYHARKTQHVFLCRAVRQVGPPTEPNHWPVWRTPDEAARVMTAPGEVEMLRAVLG